MGDRRRFELSEEDRALLHDVHEAVQCREQHAERHHADTRATLERLEARLAEQGLQMEDLRRELQTSERSGAEAVDLDAKEKLFMDQIMYLLSQTAISSETTGEAHSTCSARTRVGARAV